MQAEDIQNQFSAADTVIMVKPNKNIVEETSFSLGIPSLPRALEQHQEIAQAISATGAKIITIASETSSSTAHNVSKSAVITDSFAIIGNACDESDRKQLAGTLAGMRFMQFISGNGKLDANDVLRADNQFFIALSDNTNEEGAAQLAFFLTEYGYEATIIDNLNLSSDKPLNSMALYLGNNLMMIDRKISKNFNFIGFEQIVVPTSERGATNSLFINDTLIIARGYNKTIEKLKKAGVKITELNITEFEKVGSGIKSMALAMPSLKKEADNNISVTNIHQFKVA